MVTEIQEEAIQITVRAGTVTLSTLLRLMAALARQYKQVTHGKQSLRKLNLQNRELVSYDFMGADMQALRRELRRYQDFLASCRKLSPYPIEFENIASPNVRGYCSFEEQRIVVRSGLSQVQTAKTVLHEITHAILHNEGDAKTRAEKELEALYPCFYNVDFLYYFP